MTESQRHTSAELLAILSARQLEDGQVVFAGVGVPLLAATLAQRLHCPGLTILFEGGVIGAFVEPGKLPPSTNDQRCTKRANMVLGSADVLLLLQRGYVDVGFMGGAQIDQYGNLNSSFIGDPAKPKTRLPGTGGGNDISSLTNMIVAMKHEKRRFVEKVDFITSPGFLRGGKTRAESGLPAGGMFRVLTELAGVGFDDETVEDRQRRPRPASAQSCDARQTALQHRPSLRGAPHHGHGLGLVQARVRRGRRSVRQTRQAHGRESRYLE